MLLAVAKAVDPRGALLIALTTETVWSPLSRSGSLLGPFPSSADLHHPVCKWVYGAYSSV